MNKIILKGRICHELELKNTPQGVPVCSFSIAVDRRFKINGEKVTDFFDIVAWRQMAEFVFKYFAKGQEILVCGEMQTRSYADKNGVKRKVYEVNADEIYFCGSKKDNEQATQPPQYHPTTQPTAADIQLTDDDEDLPF